MPDERFYKDMTEDFKESEEGKIILQEPPDTGKFNWRWLSSVKRNVLRWKKQTRK